jgi:hypothetical protein
MAYTKNSPTMAMSSHGTHQLALRRRSVKVLLGAMKASMMRAPWESGAVSGVAGLGGIGMGAAAMRPPLSDYVPDCIVGEISRQGRIGERRGKPANDGFTPADRE